MNIDPSVLTSLFKTGTLATVKISLLILIALYAAFIFMLGTKIRSLNKTVFLPPQSGEVIIRVFALLYFLAVLSLFVLTLVIV